MEQTTGQVGTGALREVVGAGQVSLAPETGELLHRALKEQLDQVESWLERAGRLARRAPLGAHPVADAMGGKFGGRADGHCRSFTAVLRAYREVLRQADEVVTCAIGNYQRVDEEYGQVVFQRVDRC